MSLCGGRTAFDYSSASVLLNWEEPVSPVKLRMHHMRTKQQNKTGNDALLLLVQRRWTLMSESDQLNLWAKQGSETLAGQWDVPVKIPLDPSDVRCLLLIVLNCPLWCHNDLLSCRSEQLVTNNLLQPSVQPEEDFITETTVFSTTSLVSQKYMLSYWNVFSTDWCTLI